MVYFIHHWQQYKHPSQPSAKLASYTFWWGKFFSNSINITFKLCITQFLLLNIFSFSWDFSAYQLDFFIFWVLNRWIFCVTFHLFQCFWISDFCNFMDAVNAGYLGWEKAHCVAFVTRTANNILKNISYANSFWCVQWNASNLGHTLPG